MKNKNSIFWFLAFIFLTILANVVIVLESVELQKHLIDEIPDSIYISRVERIELLAALSLVIIVVISIFGVRNMLRRNRAIKEYVKEKEVEEPKNEKKGEEEKEQQEIRVANAVEKISNSIDSFSLKSAAESYLIALSKQFEIAQGIFYFREKDADEFSLLASYAYYTEEDSVRSFKLGHGLPGQVAQNKEFLNLSNLPEKYLAIMSGLGKGSPRHLVIFPILIENETVAVIELASFVSFTTEGEAIIKEAGKRFSQLPVFSV